MSKVKTGPNPIIVVAGLVVIAALLFNAPKLKEALEDDDAVIVVVDFAPNKRTGKPAPGRMFSDHVAIEIQAGLESEKIVATRSPWTRVYHPMNAKKPKTTKFIVIASQVYGDNLGVVVNRGKTEQCSDRKTGPSQVTCTYTFRP